MLRGSMYTADLGKGVGSEQQHLRPVLIVQNDVGNQHSPTVIVAVITSKQTKAKIPTHIPISKGYLKEDSVIMLEQLRTIDKSRLITYIGVLDEVETSKVNKALRISLNL